MDNPRPAWSPLKRSATLSPAAGLMETLRRQASQKAVAGASAAESQDFLYNDVGLPE